MWDEKVTVFLRSLFLTVCTFIMVNLHADKLEVYHYNKVVSDKTVCILWL